jgi:hypothetical protein
MCGSIQTSLATFAVSAACMASVWQMASVQRPDGWPPPHIRYLVASVMAFATMQLVDAGLWLTIQRNDVAANRFIGRVILPVVLCVEILVSYYGAVYWLNAPRSMWYEAILWMMVVGLFVTVCWGGMPSSVGSDGYLRWCGSSTAPMGHIGPLLFLASLVGPFFVFYPDRFVAALGLVLGVSLFVASAALGNDYGTFGTRWCWSANVFAPVCALLVATGTLR